VKVCVLGSWHLATVTAACLASAGHEVTGLDDDEAQIAELRNGRAPISEPGLDDLLRSGRAARRLDFTTDPAAALAEAEVLWVAYDTPVDDEDRADVEFVIQRVTRLFPQLRDGTLVLISSQMPVGSTAGLEKMFAAARPGSTVGFGYSPENLRLGKAIGVFLQPDRVVVGVRSERDRQCVTALLAPITDKIQWMSVESAEMTKHAINAFLATSVAFINEIATLCEQVGADAKEVERGLKSEQRIGPKAYLSPGAAFAGGTLARDIAFLSQVGAKHAEPLHLLNAVRASNDAHKQWLQKKLRHVLGPLQDQVVAVWGLTYKPGTDTLRRSSAVELCRWLLQQGARVQAHDPAVRELPDALAIHLSPTPADALDGAAALVVATEWPDYRAVRSDVVVARMRVPRVIDANRFLAAGLGHDARIAYATIGEAPTDASS
jgi:UDPglucose 6-dehydrogenase